MINFKFYLITFICKVKPALKKQFGKNLARQVWNRTKDHYNEIDSRHPKQKGIMEFHRMLLMMGLALYRSMQDESVGEKDDLIEQIHKLYCQSRFFKIVKLQAFFIRNSKDPYENFLKHLGPKNEWFFPCPPWEKVPVKIENGTGWHQKKCPYYDFNKEEDTPELCSALGDMDIQMAGLLPNHIELKREKALCWGDDYCDFLYYKK